MWAGIAKWYRDWDQELQSLLLQPELAAAMAPGWRRKMGVKIALLTPVERQEMYRFQVTYRGAALWRALASLCLVFSVTGALLKLAYLPALPMSLALLGANGVGFAMLMAMITVWFNHASYARPGRRIITGVLGVILLGTVYGAAVAVLFKDGSWQSFRDLLPKVLTYTGIAMLLLIVLPGFLLATVRNRHYDLLASQLTQQAEQERLARELSETRLRLLRAQIEPHFLFNTLGAVQQLAEQGAPRAAELTAHLIDFLRASMSDMRCEQVPLRAEFRLVESYLRVMQVRMGTRLHVRLSLPPALESTPVPCMILLTLAENAIKHGIEPALHGGDIAVLAEDGGDVLRLQVVDSGVGMSATPGNGTGLQNIRERLRLSYGDAASLALSEAEPGLAVEILIPRKTNA